VTATANACATAPAEVEPLARSGQRGPGAWGV